MGSPETNVLQEESVGDAVRSDMVSFRQEIAAYKESEMNGTRNSVHLRLVEVEELNEDDMEMWKMVKGNGQEALKHLDRYADSMDSTSSLSRAKFLEFIRNKLAPLKFLPKKG